MTTSATSGPIDVDSHVIEPADLWTSRISSKWGDRIPHVRFDKENQQDAWFIGDEILSPTGFFAMVGWKNVFPDYPPSLDEAQEAGYNPVARLKLLDEYGIQAQVIYPNLTGGFFADRFMQMEPELALDCVRAYNDFLTDFCSVAPDRLIALTSLPFWDIEASVKEMERCMAAGHRGVLFAHTFEQVGLPNIPDERWHPILDAAQSLGQSINFHIGFADDAKRDPRDGLAEMRRTPRKQIADRASLGFLSNAKAINLLIFYGVCERYPDLKFVCVESGFGFVPFQLEAMDWQWENNGMREDHPDWLLPSEYFRRQMYATMWFEKPATEPVEAWQDNLMWETDYPHPTAQWPTPTSAVALKPELAIDRMFADVSNGARQKIVRDNAAKLYRIN